MSDAPILNVRGLEVPGDQGIEAALEGLRLADAKHRLACALTRAAWIDLERGRGERALARAAEALECAEALERSTEIVLAHSLLARAHEAVGDAGAAASHRQAIEGVDSTLVARWAWA